MSEFSAFLKAQKTITFSILGNIFLAALKILAGIFGHSFALIADGIESLTDVFSSFLVWVGIRYANRPADENHPYGHGKAEPLITFGVVLMLVIAAIFIAFQAVVNFSKPQEKPEFFTLLVLGGIIIFKEVMYRIVLKTGEKTQSTALAADAWHHRSDAITSFAALIGVSLAIFFGEGWEIADEIAALVAAVFIIINAYLIFRPALGEIMDEHIYDEFIEEIKTSAKEVQGVVSTEKCFVRKHGMQFNVDLHLIVPGKITVQDGHDIAHRVKDKLMFEFPEIMDVLIHVEPDVCRVEI